MKKILLTIVIAFSIMNVNAQENNLKKLAELQQEIINASSEIAPKEEIDNPQTGESAPYSLLPIGILGLSLLIILRKINNFQKI